MFKDHFVDENCHLRTHSGERATDALISAIKRIDLPLAEFLQDKIWDTYIANFENQFDINFENQPNERPSVFVNQRAISGSMKKVSIRTASEWAYGTIMGDEKVLKIVHEAAKDVFGECLLDVEYKQPYTIFQHG